MSHRWCRPLETSGCDLKQCPCRYHGRQGGHDPDGEQEVVMFGKRIDLFKLFGFEIRIDLSWVVLAILVAWSLSAGLFPFRYEGLSTQTWPGSTVSSPSSTSFPPSRWTEAAFSGLSCGAGRKICGGPPGLPPESGPDSACFSFLWEFSSSWAETI